MAQRIGIISSSWTIALCSVAFFCAPVRADKLPVAPEVLAAVDQVFRISPMDRKVTMQTQWSGAVIGYMAITCRVALMNSA